MFLKVLLLTLGGGIGTLVRYWVSGLTHKYVAGIFPWGTIVVNASGALIIGILWGLFEDRGLNTMQRSFFFIGILGGYTTFSTYALESMHLFQAGELRLGFLNILASNFLSLGFVFAGYYFIRIVMSLSK